MNFRARQSDKVWYQGEIWNLEQVFEGDMDLVYFLLKKTEREDGFEAPIGEMVLVEALQQVIFPDTPEVRKLMKKLRKLKNMVGDIKSSLSDLWLEFVDVE